MRVQGLAKTKTGPELLSSTKALLAEEQMKVSDSSSIRRKNSSPHYRDSNGRKGKIN